MARLNINNGWQVPPDIIASCTGGSGNYSNSDIMAAFHETSDSLERLKRCMADLEQANDLDTACRALDDLMAVLPSAGAADEILDTDDSPSFQMLSRLQDYNNSVEYMQSEGVHHLILHIMRAFPLTTHIQEAGCQLLVRLMKMDKELRNDVQMSDAYMLVLEALHNHTSDPAIQSSAIHAVMILARSEPTRHMLLYSDNAVIPAIVAAMSSFPDIPDIQALGSEAMNSVLVGEPKWQKKFVEQRGHQVAVQAINSHLNHASIVTQAWQLLHILCEQGLLSESLHEEGLLNTAMSSLRTHSADGAIVLPCLVILSAICSANPRHEALVPSEADLGQLLLDILTTHQNDDTIQARAINIWVSVADVWFDQLGDHQEERWLDRVYEAFHQHLLSAYVQEVCCRGLAKLLEHCSGLQSLIGEEDGEKALHTCCGLGLLVHGREVDVFTAACDAIYWCSADNERLQNLLVEKNIHQHILRLMKDHRRDERAQEQGCRAIKGLCIFSQSNKLKVSLDGALNELRRALKNFTESAAVQVEALAAIGCLADTELLRDECMTSEVYWKVLLALKTHRDHVLLQETGLEALTIFAGADGAVEKLLEARALEQIICTMENHKDNAVIQKKALVLVQLLAVSDSAYCWTDLCHRLVSVIIGAMNHHQRAFGVQTEGCVAMQVLAETNEFLAEALVDNQVHECLFYILENYQLAKDLQDLASECLYVLGCHRNLKSQMLLAACAEGHLEGVECLVELGAEVNIGNEEKTPLCVACEIGHERLVAFLLAQGVSDLQMALKYSLDRGHSRIIGMLLKHIGNDTEGALVSWSGLSLGDIQHEWLYLTFMGSSLHKPLSETGRSLAAQVKQMETRRSRRLHSRCDSSLRSPTRLPMRFRFETEAELRHGLRDYPSWVPNYAESESDEADSEGATCLPVRVKALEAIKTKFRLQRLKSSPAMFGSRSRDIPRDSNTWPVPPVRERKTRAELAQSLRHRTQSEVGVKCRFEVHVEDLDEWKRTTLTSSNVPFSPLDPRRTDATEHVPQPSVHSSSGVWMRKSSSQVALLQSLDDETDLGGATTDQSHAEAKKSLHSSASESRLWRASFTAIGSHSNISEGASDMLPIPDEESSDKHSGQSHLSEKYDTDTGPESGEPKNTKRVRRNTTQEESPRSKKRDSLTSSSKRTVRYLELCNNHISSLDGILHGDARFLEKFANICKLDLTQNQLQSIPVELLQSLISLENLNLNSNKFDVFPSAVLTCPRLDTLHLAHNQLTSLGADPGHMAPALKVLVLSHNSLDAVPHWLGRNCPGLETLDLTRNKIEKLGDGDLQLRRLKTLNMSYNNIACIPDTFLDGFPQLETFTVDGNNLDGLPSEECSSHLPRLSTLRVANNKLSGKEPFYLPKFILELPSLRVLDLSHNQLTGIPEASMWKTSTLKELNVTHNQIKKLTFGANAKVYTSMERLNVSHNKLQELPREIGQLLLLNSLDISHNPNLSSIPDELGRLSKLWEFQIHGLKLDLDEAILKGRTRNLVRYLHEKLKRAVEYRHMKLMVVGYGGRGKTSLLRQLSRSGDQGNQPTVGIVVREWKISGRGVNYTLHTWDFAGQEDFYSTHQCFLSNRALYLVVYNLHLGMRELDTLRPWLLNIAARAPSCPVIIVGTHLDLLPRDERDDIVSEMRQAILDMCERPGFPTVKGITEVDGTGENAGIDRLRRIIKEGIDSFEVKGQRVIEQKIPASYLRLQNLLSEEAYILKQKLPIITHRRVVKIVKEAGLDLDEEELQQAVRFLHEAGVLLHYEDAALKLNDLYFLDPEWLCRMMAQIVTVREINPFVDKKGILKKEDVKVLFSDRRSGNGPSPFPSHLIPQYLRLLEKFEIALPHSDEELLIPCRLPLERPTFYLPSHIYRRTPQGFVQEPQARVQRRYEMQYIPIGLWSRLVTRLLSFASSTLMELDVGERCPVEMHLWREGIYICYSAEAYFLIEPLHPQLEVIVVTVPMTRRGYRLLGQIVDHIDGLIDEWYPGLTQKCPMGEVLVERKIPCIKCLRAPHLFKLSNLVTQSETQDSVYCPRHNGHVPLTSLAPDVVLSDLDQHFILHESDINLVESPENLLGNGAFGRVYKGRFRNQQVAIKMFLPIGDIHPHHTMRQEVTILRRLDHPSLVSMVGVCLRPRMLMLELAPLGSLASLLKQKRVTNHLLQHRIAVQVSEGLTYLHRYMIIYRDMKPDNVLIFSLSLAVPVNAKISDYGISRFISLYGVSLPEGTPGYRAPEVARGEAYSFQADVFSLGIMMYELVTGGRHPYQELTFHNELDDAVMRGLPILPISQVAPPWPDVQELIDQCLRQVPEERPSSEQVNHTLRNVELLSLRQVIPISKDTGVSCIAIQRGPAGESEAWVACGVVGRDLRDVQLARVSLSQSAQEPKGWMHQDSHILCMLPLGSSSMLLGTQTGRIWVYNTAEHMQFHLVSELPDAVLCMVHYTGSHGVDCVYAGLANGQLAVYQAKDILSSKQMTGDAPSDSAHDQPAIPKPQFIHVSCEPTSRAEPIQALCIFRPFSKLCVSAGSRIYVYNIQSHPSLDHSWNTNLEGIHSCQIRHLVVSGRRIHLSKRDQSVVEMWHATQQRLRKKVKVSSIISLGRDNANGKGLSDYECRVTALSLVTSATLWVGTHSGHLVLLDASNYNHLMVIRRHLAEIRCISCVKSGAVSMAITGGLGFSGLRDSEHDLIYSREQYNVGYLAMWNQDMGQQTRHLVEYEKRRKDWAATHCRKNTV